MPSVKCTLKGCAHIGKRGACTRKNIVLQQTSDQCNELYCLGWNTPEQKLMDEVIKNTTEQK